MTNELGQTPSSSQEGGSEKSWPDREQARKISAVIRAAEKRLRRKYPLLNHQDLIGTLILVFSVCGFVGSSALYLGGLIPAWLCVVFNALFASLLHELEHDLIHNLYFHRRPWAHNAMMLVVWVFRGNTINPWYRRRLHLLHHKESGQHTDLEERLIGLGMRYGFPRLLSTLDGLVGSLARYQELSKIPACQPRSLILAGVPMMTFFSLVWHGWLLYHATTIIIALLGFSLEAPPWLALLVSILNAAAVVYALPNVLRQTSLNIVSSSIHYYGDVNGLLQQTQVADAWFLWPLQLFCFNFGGTHAIHHFVASQPFYLRQMIARPARAAMKKHGVRFNDMGAVGRANRFAAPDVST
ncbi:MAG: fatty acid desaturase [Planctomycetales bacterium]